MHAYDLEERTKRFAYTVIDLMKQIKQNSINKRMIEQVIASSGSIGANYCEAVEAESRKDFIHKIGICKKETKETRHWLELLQYANSDLKEKFIQVLKEVQELLLIFSKTLITSRKNA